MELKTYFFDTYALYEILHGNPNYKSYEKNVSIITTLLNLMELHFILLRIYDSKIANEAFDKFLEYIIDIKIEKIKEVNLFKFHYKTKKFSYVDCIGYVLARKLRVEFLTGDKAFENLENVRFVK
jgi:uncharacterized protein